MGDEATLLTLHGRVTTGTLALLGALQIYRWVARRKLTLGYGLVWLAICGMLLAAAVMPDILLWLGWLAGSRRPDGAMRLAGFVFVAVVLLYLSLRVSALEAKIETLVQALALTRDGQLAPADDADPTHTAADPIAHRGS